LETVKTNKTVAFFLARRQKGEEDLPPFDQTRKQPKVEVVEIGARRDLQTTYIVKSGDSLNWTFAVKTHDISFRVGLRRMMDVGGADMEELVPAVKVDSRAAAEGAYAVTQDGTAVLVWDNSYSVLRSKTIAYRAWIDRAAPDGGKPAEEATNLGGNPARESEVGAGEKAKKEAEDMAKAEAEEKAKKEAEEKAKKEAEEKAKAEAEEKAKAEDKA